MADLVITAANVAKVSGGTIDNSFVGAVALTQGQVVYLDSSVSKWKLAQADGTALESGNGTKFGITLNQCAANQPVSVFVPSSGQSAIINVGATTAVGQVYVVSATAGGIAPYADIISTQYYTFLGWGKTTGGQIEMLGANATGLVKA